jgi:hypothetical protein
MGEKRVYKTKHKVDGSVERHNARLAAKGYSQKTSICYNEKTSHIAILNTINCLVESTTQFK